MEKEFFQKLEDLNPNMENWMLTVLDGNYAGQKSLVSGGQIVGKSKEDGFWDAHGAKISGVKKSGIVQIAGQKVYAEHLGAEKILVICGAGHVSIPIIRIGKMIGFHVICIDDRPDFAGNAEKAGADDVICAPFEEALEKVPGSADTYFVIVTRGHRYDQDCLRRTCRKMHAYIGMMGSKRRVAIVKEKLAEEGIAREILDSVYTPIGLKIEAQTPEEIAVSVMAEIIQVKNREQRNFGFPEDIYDALVQDGCGGVLKDDRKILATIVSRKGSAPRETGTKMLILPDGRTVGTIGGGCVEADVMRKGRELLLEEDPQPLVYHVDLTDSAGAEEGMVCGGVLDVLLETVS